MKLQFTARQITAQQALADAQFGSNTTNHAIKGVRDLINAGMYAPAAAAIEYLMVTECGWTQYQGHFTDGTWKPVTVTETIKYRRNYMRIPAGTVVLATDRDPYAGLQVWDPFTGNVVAGVDFGAVKPL